MSKPESSSAPAAPDATLKTDSPTPYPYRLAWDKLGRRGQACKIIANNQTTCSVEFEDGFFFVFDRRAIRLRK